MKKLFAVIGGAVGVYIVIVLLIAVIPAIQLSQVPPGPGVEPLTELQAQGRDVYVSNGCSFCHTQQVRPIDADKPFGRPSAPGDFAYQTPELLGSERTGPDLTNVGKRKPSDVWQYIHLWNPRAVVPESIMPNFKYLFRVVDEVPEGETAVPVPAEFGPADGKVIPTDKAKALVVYLLSLKQAPLPDAATAGGPVSQAPEVAQQAGDSDQDAGQAGAADAGNASGGYSFDAAKGKDLYVANCSACHQDNGQGIPSAFPPLDGNPAVNDPDPTLHIDTILHGASGTTIQGVTYNSVMPPFAGQLSDAEIADIVNHERSSWGNDAAHVTPQDVAEIRAKGN